MAKSVVNAEFVDYRIERLGENRIRESLLSELFAKLNLCDDGRQRVVRICEMAVEDVLDKNSHVVPNKKRYLIEAHVGLLHAKDANCGEDILELPANAKIKEKDGVEKATVGRMAFLRVDGCWQRYK